MFHSSNMGGDSRIYLKGTDTHCFVERCEKGKIDFPLTTIISSASNPILTAHSQADGYMGRSN